MHDFVIYFFYFHVVNAVALLYIIGDNNYFLDSLFLNGYGNIKYGLVQSLNVIVNYSHARTEGCLQNAFNWDMRKLCTSVQP